MEKKGLFAYFLCEKRLFPAAQKGGLFVFKPPLPSKSVHTRILRIHLKSPSSSWPRAKTRENERPVLSLDSAFFFLVGLSRGMIEGTLAREKPGPCSNASQPCRVGCRPRFCTWAIAQCERPPREPFLTEAELSEVYTDASANTKLETLTLASVCCALGHLTFMAFL